MPLPTTLLKWTKYAVRAAGEVAPFLLSKLDYDHESDPDTLKWYRLQTVWSRTTPAGTVEDRAICTFDLVNITGGVPDATWITSDFTSAEAKFDTFFNVVRSYQTNNHTLVEYRWYPMTFAPITDAPLDKQKPFNPSLYPDRVTTKSVAGTGTTPLPYQVSMAITEKTALPKHWGRFYIPGINGTLMATGGRWVMVGGANDILAAADTMYEALAGAELYPVVPITQVAKVPVRALLGVTSLQVDDIPDIVRRRRPKQAAVRTQSTP